MRSWLIEEYPGLRRDVRLMATLERFRYTEVRDFSRYRFYINHIDQNLVDFTLIAG